MLWRAASQHGQSAPLTVLQLGSCASGRAWWLWAARHQVLELAAFNVAHCTALGHSGEPPLKKKGKGKKGKGKKGGFKRRAKQMGQSDP